ncbi:uncharacterized protein LOC119836724 isoform X2 [Zerene cesonia]|nr:uncharacterized protein LOC119836724 isoform X2 [Zerene cesonia]
MKTLHTGLHLRGAFPALAKSSYFKRFQQEVIEERAKSIKHLLEFVAEHRLLFTSTDFVNFLQSGYPDPEPKGVINAIRSSLHLPVEDTPPLEYPTSDEDSRSPETQNMNSTNTSPINSNTQMDVSQIPIYEAADIEIRQSPLQKSNTNSFESLDSLDSIGSDLYEELNKVTIRKTKSFVKKNVLPDLINFDAPSTSKFDDYHTMPRNINSDKDMVDSVDLNEQKSLTTSTSQLDSRSFDAASLGSFGRSRRSSYSMLSLSNVECRTRTEDSYVFEAGYLLNLAARCEDVGDFQRSFECYKSGIEKMLIGVQSDTDPQRRALIKDKTSKYLSYAEEIYKKHLSGTEQSLLPERDSDMPKPNHSPIPLSMLKRPYEDLGLYRVLGVLGSSIMLVLHKTEQTCYAMKVIQKIPHNLTEFDDYFQQQSPTRQPILPTLIPYMVPLHAYVETNNLFFLILSYAPGEKLFDYIKNYAKSIPNTPAKVNLENVFPKIDLENESIVDLNRNIDSEASVKELVMNSQKLLMNVDRVLTDSDVRQSNSVVQETASVEKIVKNPRDVLPPSTICKWGAEILTAIESLHNCGVILRDLNPNNILLSEGGQITLTYIVHYPGAEVCAAQVRGAGVYCAPELLRPLGGGAPEGGACDYWSYGALMYYLICGVPLSHFHNEFTSHTILQLPEGLSVEVESFLTQLLTYEPSERLGSGRDGIEEIKQHPYFKNIDWQNVYNSWIVPD